MAEITAAMVKDLREMTGAGMMDCKAALKETNGDMDAAVDWLRKKGLAKAAKKSGRTASDGLVAVAQNATGLRAILVEVNSETDFVARNEIFQGMVAEVARAGLATDGSTEALRAATFPGSDKSIEAHIAEMVGQIGENLSLRRSTLLSVEQGVVAAYIHGQVVEGAGKIGVIVALESNGDQARLATLGRQIAMHIAAARPLSGTIADLDPSVVERERAVLADQARGSGKGEDIVAKMVEGRLRKFYEESVLLEQIFVIDGETRVGAVIDKLAKEISAPIKFVGFARLELGEGVERKADED